MIYKNVEFRVHEFKFEGESISIQPDLFLTDRHSQDFQSVFGNHNKTYVQNLGVIGSLVDNLSRLQAWPVSQMIFSSNLVLV